MLALNPESFFVNRFWGRRPDRVAINEALQIEYIFEFKWSTDRDEGFLEMKEAEANEQDHVTQVCEAHNRVIVSFLQVQRGTRPTTEGSRENIGHNVHV